MMDSEQQDAAMELSRCAAVLEEIFYGRWDMLSADDIEEGRERCQRMLELMSVIQPTGGD